MAVTPLHDSDLPRLERCLSLAEEALLSGDQPFGSVLVDADGREVFAARNRVAEGDDTQHAELALARWAAANLAPAARSRATVYTSSEHCPMCAAAHGWVGLGRIVYASSSEQLDGWLRGFGLAATPTCAAPSPTWPTGCAAFTPATTTPTTDEQPVPEPGHGDGLASADARDVEADVCG